MEGGFHVIRIFTKVYKSVPFINKYMNGKQSVSDPVLLDFHILCERKTGIRRVPGDIKSLSLAFVVCSFISLLIY